MKEIKSDVKGRDRKGAQTMTVIFKDREREGKEGEGRQGKEGTTNLCHASLT